MKRVFRGSFNRILKTIIFYVFFPFILSDNVYALNTLKSVDVQKVCRILSHELLFSNQVIDENVIYEIRDDFNLNGGIITDGCYG